MKLKTWNKLKKGDVVRVRTLDELTNLKKVQFHGCVLEYMTIYDDIQPFSFTFYAGHDRTDLFGGEYCILEIGSNGAKKIGNEEVTFWVTRKMLAEEAR